jgi:DNA polymerase sigma
VFPSDELKYYLNEEINYFIESIERQNEQQKIFLKELITKITSKIKNNFGATIQVFGSFATELCLTESDIDMVIIPDLTKDTPSSFKLLEEIANMLETKTEEV